MSAVNMCVKNVGILVNPIVIFPLLSQRTGSMSILCVLMTGCLIMVSATGYYQRKKQEPGRSLPRHVALRGANLTSLHSLSEVEMLLRLLTNCKAHRNVKFIFGEIYQVNTTQCFVCVNMNAMFCRFRGEFECVDWSLETGSITDCRVV